MKKQSTINLVTFVFILFLLTSCKEESKNSNSVNRFAVNSISKISSKDYQKNRKTANVLGQVKEVICTDYQQFVPDNLLENLVTKMNYKFHLNGNILEEVCILTNDEFNYKYNYYFDKMNNALITVSYDKNNNQKFIKKDSLNSNGLFISTVIEEKGKVLTTSRNYTNITDSAIIFNLISKVLYNNKIVDESNWNSKIHKFTKGNLTEMGNLNKGKFEVTERIKYDKRDNVIEKNDFITNTHWIMKYDSDDRKIYFFSENNDYNSKNEYFYKYDKFGNIIEQTSFKKDVINPKGTFKCEYIYDKQNNWIEKKVYKLSGEKISHTTRKITYY